MENTSPTSTRTACGTAATSPTAPHGRRIPIAPTARTSSRPVDSIMSSSSVSATARLRSRRSAHSRRRTWSATSLKFDANPLAPDVLKTVTFAGDTKELKWDSVSPRLGFTYKLSNKTLLRGSYNRYVDQLGGNVMSAGNPFSYAHGIYYYWTDSNHDKTVQRSEIDFT